ncbi:hypothetical protein QOT17_010921 [Balamuthia mandrillaris]
MQVLGEQSSCWSSLTHEASFSIFPALTHKLLCYLFATPTVARPKQEEVYSSSVNRSGKFADGCDFAESNIRFIISNGHALLHNRCRPSMSASKKYHSPLHLDSTCFATDNQFFLGGNYGNECGASVFARMVRAVVIVHI